jgi:hypothetical protein
MNVFSKMMSKVYDNTINWAFASKDILHELAKVNGGSSIVDDNGGIVYSDSDGKTLDVPLTITNLISFFTVMHLHYNGGKGTRDVVKFLGADFVDDMQIKCLIQLSNDTILLVDPETLNFIENPDVASIPQMTDDYIHEIQHISTLQMQNLVSPISISPLQEERVESQQSITSYSFSEVDCYGTAKRDS